MQPIDNSSHRPAQPESLRALFDYDLFICYRRRDGAKCAHWLKDKLETYRPPPDFRDASFRPIRPFLDVSFPRAGSKNWWDEHIRPQLERSRRMILILTPAVRGQHPPGEEDWIAKELTAFASSGRDMLLAVGKGSFAAPTPDGFPGALPQRIDLRATQSSWQSWRQRHFLEDELLSVIAPVLDVPTPAIPKLREDEKKRRQRRTRLWAIGTTIIAIAMLALAIGAFIELTKARIELTRSQTLQGEIVDQDRPATASLYFASAVEAAHLPFLTAPQLDDSIARVRIGWYLRERSPIISWHDGASSVEFNRKGNRLVTAGYRDARVWDVGTGDPVGRPLLHGGKLNAAVFSPGGEWVATAGADGNVRIWNAETGEQGNSLAHTGQANVQVRFVAFSPDGKLLLALGSDHLARLWDVSTGSPIGVPWRHNGQPCGSSPVGPANRTDYTLTSAVFSPNGMWAVTASSCSAGLWRVSTGLPSGDLMTHDDAILSVAFNGAGTLIATASKDKTVKLWNAKTGLQEKKALKHPDWVWSAWFNWDDTMIVTACRDGVARIWDTRTGALRKELRHGGLDYMGIYSARFSPDGERVVTASSDHTARVWSVKTGRTLGEFMQHSGQVFDAKFSPDGRSIATVGSDETIRLWAMNPDAFTRKLTHSKTHLSESGDSIDGDGVNFAVFSPDNAHVVTAGADGKAHIWDVRTGNRVGMPMEHSEEVVMARFSPDGTMLVTASKDRTARVWNAHDGVSISKMPHGGIVNSVGFSPDSKRIVTASRDCARVWDDLSGRPRDIVLRHLKPVSYAEFSHDGRKIVTACDDGCARIWDAKSGNLMATTLPPGGAVEHVAFSPDDKLIVTASDDGTGRLFYADTGKGFRAEMKHEEVYYSQIVHACFSPDGARIATAGLDSTARVWDTKTGAPVTEPLRHGGAVQFVSFSPDGSLLVTASDDNSARLWDVETGRLVGKPLAHDWVVNTASFSANGHFVLTASMDGTARIWNISPILGTPSDVLLHIEVATGLSAGGITANGQMLTEKQWVDRRTRLWRLQGKSDLPASRSE